MLHSIHIGFNFTRTVVFPCSFIWFVMDLFNCTQTSPLVPQSPTRDQTMRVSAQCTKLCNSIEDPNVCKSELHTLYIFVCVGGFSNCENDFVIPFQPFLLLRYHLINVCSLLVNVLVILHVLILSQLF